MTHLSPPYQLILASASPRRQEFLRNLGLDFTIQVAALDETPAVDEAPIALAHRLAEAKARAVTNRLPTSGAPYLIIAADTVVALGTTLLGKPVDDNDARQMLEQLRNRPHEVHTGLSLYAPQTNRQQTRVNTTQVFMRDYTDAELAAYIATGDPLDKAGAYAIQHPEFAPVRVIEGCISGVIGLPLGDLRDLLTTFGVAVTQPLAAICTGRTGFTCCQRQKVG